MFDHPAEESSQRVGVHRCLACGTPRLKSVAACPYCEHRRSVELPVQLSFGIGSLMLLTTLVAVLLSIMITVPGLGILLAILSVPAYVRAWSCIARRQALGRNVNVGDRVLPFLNSLYVVFLILLSACGALFVTCSISVGTVTLAGSVLQGSPGGGLHHLAILAVSFLAVISFVLSLVSALYVGILAVRSLWPHQD